MHYEAVIWNKKYMHESEWRTIPFELDDATPWDLVINMFKPEWAVKDFHAVPVSLPVPRAGYVECESCGQMWDTLSPCALCFVRETMSTREW